MTSSTFFLNLKNDVVNCGEVTNLGLGADTGTVTRQKRTMSAVRGTGGRLPAAEGASNAQV